MRNRPEAPLPQPFANPEVLDHTLARDWGSVAVSKGMAALGMLPVKNPVFRSISLKTKEAIAHLPQPVGIRIMTIPEGESDDGDRPDSLKEAWPMTYRIDERVARSDFIRHICNDAREQAPTTILAHLYHVPTMQHRRAKVAAAGMLTAGGVIMATAEGGDPMSAGTAGLIFFGLFTAYQLARHIDDRETDNHRLQHIYPSYARWLGSQIASDIFHAYTPPF